MNPLHFDRKSIHAILSDIRKKARESKHPVLVAITGIGGSGKSALCSILQQQLQHCSIFNLDCYYFGKEARNKNGITGAHPDSFDKRMAQRALLAAREGKTVFIPKEPIEAGGMGEFTPEKIILVDGQTALFIPWWESMYDSIILVECPEAVLWERKKRQGDTREIFELRLKQFHEHVGQYRSAVDFFVQ